MNVTFIGLGIMGQAMANNLLKENVKLTVCNRTKSKAQPLIDGGANWQNNPTDAVAEADVVFTMLSEPRVVEEVAFGNNGFVKAMKPRAVWADCTTVNPSFSKAMANKAADAGIRFMDTPVAGSRVPAENGELVFLVGGESQDLETISPFLDMMGKKTLHMGEAGKGAAMKMVVNMMLGHAMAAFSESVHLGVSLGIDRDFLMETLASLPVSAPFLAYKAGRMKQENYEVEFPLEWMQKDLHLATVSAWEQDIALPVTNAAKELYALAKQQGLSRKDLSAVFKTLTKKSGQE